MLKELSFNAESLAVVAADLDLTAQVSSPFSRAGGDGVAAYPAVIKAAFSSEVVDDKYASEVLDLGNDRYIVIKLNESIPARQKELSEVRSAVVNALSASNAKQILLSRAPLYSPQLRRGKRRGCGEGQCSGLAGCPWC